MVVKHYLNGTEIDEPIGFDSLKMTMKRGEYHGMSAEVSEQTLEFYNTAADLIRAAYQTDLDTELTYRVTADGEEMYSGVLDLSTYEEQYSDYCSVSCKVGEVGVKTTFNNRTDVEIDLNGTKTIDGKSLAHSYPWERLVLPQRVIQYVNYIKEAEQNQYDGTLPDEFRWAFIDLVYDTKSLNEFGSLVDKWFQASKIGENKFGSSQNHNTIPNIAKTFTSYYTPTDSEDTDYDDNSYIHISLQLKGSIVFDTSLFTNTGSGTANLYIYPQLVLNGSVSTDGQYIVANNSNYSAKQSFSISIDEYIQVGQLNSLLFGLFMRNDNYQYYSGGIQYLNNPAPFHIVIDSDSSLKMELKSNRSKEVSADTMFVHEALNKVVESISENALTVKSELYSRFDSVLNPHTATSDNLYQYGHYFGESALKVITNGYKIRGLYTTTDKERNMPMSFKTLIEALDTIDCIGWGFSEESGTTCVRVERWSWFYKTGEPILRITAPKEVKTAIDTSLIISELTIGYKKYTTNEDISSIDSIMSERTFTTSTKAVSQSASKLCSFIADNYATELTRRAALKANPDEEYKYDENIFLFSAYWAMRQEGNAYGIGSDENVGEVVGGGIGTSENYNCKISPARNAYHWINRLFCVAGIKPFACTSGTINYKAQIETVPTILLGDEERLFTIPDSVNAIPAYTQIIPSGSQVAGIKQNAENYTLRERYYKTYQLDNTGQVNTGVPSSDDVVIPRVFKAETISFTYPLSVAEYRKVKANPYGLIEVDGVLGWIKEFTYSFADGEATFKLIPKAD